MTNRHFPPGRRSKLCVVVVNPFGPHHSDKCLGSVNAANTSSRGASNTRVPMIERGSCARSRLFSSAMLRLPLAFLLFGLQSFQIVAQAIETFVPKPAIFLDR